MRAWAWAQEVTVDDALARRAKAYTEVLLARPEGAPGREYLARRGLSVDTAVAWGLGYAGSPGDRLEGRVVIPVVDAYGRVAALSGRAVAKDVYPKYYHDAVPVRRLLFGLRAAREQIVRADTAVFVEGQVDVVAAWQAGFRLAVGTFGAHFSPEHLATAARYASTVALVYDADAAGRKGTASGLAAARPGGVRVVDASGVLPEGADLDEYLRTGGTAEGLAAAVTAATTGTPRPPEASGVRQRLEEYAKGRS